MHGNEKVLQSEIHVYCGVPILLQVVGTVYNAIKGSVSANFYTDKWPDFSTLVGQIIFPRLSEVSIIELYV